MRTGTMVLLARARFDATYLMRFKLCWKNNQQNRQRLVGKVEMIDNISGNQLPPNIDFWWAGEA